MIIPEEPEYMPLWLSDQLRLIRIGESRGSWRERNDPENRASSLARLSPRLPQQWEFMRHLFVVDSLDKQIQNEKELNHPYHLASAGGGTILYLCSHMCGEY